MSMLRERAAKGSDVPALLLFSSRRWENVIFRDELLALAARNDGFQLALALTRDRPRRPQDFGRRVGADMVAELVPVCQGRRDMSSSAAAIPSSRQCRKAHLPRASIALIRTELRG